LGTAVAELLQAGCPSCHPTNSIKALKETLFPTGEYCGGCVTRLALQLQGSILPVTMTVFQTLREHAVMVSQQHCCGNTFTDWRPFLLPNQEH